MLEGVVVGLLVPLAVGVLTAWASVQLALRRFRNERWWERRVDAYSSPFRALFDVQRSLSQAVKRIEERVELSEDFQKEMSDKASTGYAEVRRSAAIATFLFSPAAAQRLEALIAVLDAPHHNQDIYEETVEDLEAVTLALRDLQDLAKRDLALR